MILDSFSKISLNDLLFSAGSVLFPVLSSWEKFMKTFWFLHNISYPSPSNGGCLSVFCLAGLLPRCSIAVSGSTDMLDSDWGCASSDEEVPELGENVERALDDEIVVDAGLSGWAEVAEAVEPQDGAHHDEVCVGANLLLSEFAEPVAKKRGRPRIVKKTVGDDERVANNQDAQPSMLQQNIRDTISLSVRHGEVMATQPPSLIVPKVKSFLRPPLHGYRPLSVCSKVLQDAMQLRSLPGQKVDNTYSKIKEQFIDSGHGFHSCSLVVRDQIMAVDKDELMKKIIVYAQGAILYSKLQRSLVEQCVTHGIPGMDLICYIDFMTYDETPLKTRVVDPVVDAEGSPQQALHAFAQVMEPNRVPSLELSVTSDSCHMKILQCRQMYALVFKTPSGFCKIYGENPCPLSALESNSALVMREALCRLSATTTHSEAFKLRTRISSMDKASANLLTETCMVASRRGHWKPLVNTCEVHTTARAFRKTFDNLVPQHISAIIHIALALRSGSAMVSFRRCLVQEIHSRLKLYYGPVPEAAVIYRQKMLSLFWTTGSNLLLRRMLVSKLPNGMWSLKEEVQVYLPLTDQGQVSKDSVARSLEKALSFVLTGSKPHVFPRHRWTGSDLSVEDLGRLECVHYLLSSTWHRFMAAHGKPEKQPMVTQLGVVDAESVSIDNVEGVGQPPHQSSLNSSDNQHPTICLETLASAENNEKTRGAQEHARDRQQGNDWLTSSLHSPLSILVMLRKAMQPLVMLLNSQLDVASLDWEKKQQAIMALHIQTQALQGPRPPLRHHQATIAAEGVLEKMFFESLSELFERPWDTIEELQWQVAMRSQIFKLLSRQGALIHVGLSVVHQGYPLTLFKLLREPHLASAMYEAAQGQQCMLDDWSQEMVRLYPGFEQPEFFQVLEAHAHLLCSSTVQVEARHSSVRRALLTRNQTWAMPFANLSADFVLMQLRRNHLACQSLVGTIPARAANKKRKLKVPHMGGTPIPCQPTTQMLMVTLLPLLYTSRGPIQC